MLQQIMFKFFSATLPTLSLRVTSFRVTTGHALVKGRFRGAEMHYTYGENNNRISISYPETLWPGENQYGGGTYPSKP